MDKLPEALHPDVQAALDRIPAYIESLHAANPFMRIAEAMEKRYPETYAWKSLSTPDAIVYVAFRFKAIGEAAEVLRWLGAEHRVHQLQKVYVHPDDKSLNWRLTGMRVVGYFAAAEAQCKFVKTGTKVVDVFEMQCEGAAEPVLNTYPPVLAAPVLELATADDGLPF